MSSKYNVLQSQFSSPSKYFISFGFVVIAKISKKCYPVVMRVTLSALFFALGKQYPVHHIHLNGN